MADAPQSRAPALRKWYSQTSARYVDLVGDYAGKERFFIEGDGLLLELFSHSQLDFEVGFQVLHAVYLVEQFLHNLYKRGCQFDVVFFQKHERNCIPPATRHPTRYLLARKVVIRHLQTNASNINVLSFLSRHDPAFQDYLDSSSVYFAACSDGSHYSTSPSKSLLLSSHVSKDPSKPSNAEQSNHLRGMIYHLLHRGLDVALLNGLEWQDSKVFAFVLERQNTKLVAVVSEIEHLDSEPQALNQPAPSPVKNGISLADLGNLPTRIQMTVATLKRCVKHNKDFSRFVSACLSHAMLLETTSLAARRVATTEFDHEIEDSVSSFIDCYSTYCSQVLDSLSEEEVTSENIIDLFDGRLFRRMLVSKGLPAAINAKALSKLVQAVFGTDQGSAATVAPTNRAVASPETPSRISSSILPFSHPAFDKHLLNLDVPVKASPRNLVVGGKISQELTHWHNSKKPLQMKKNAPQDPKARARELRSQQRFMAEMQAYATSLTNANGKSLTPELILVGSSKDSAAKTLAVRSAEPTTGNSTKAKPGQQKSSKKPTGKGKNEKIVAEIAKRADEANTALLAAWKRAREGIDASKDPYERFNQAKRYLADMRERRDAKAIVNEVELYKLSVLLVIWADYCRQTRRPQGQYVAALIYETILGLSRSNLESPSNMAKLLSDVTNRMKLDIRPGTFADAGHPLSFSFDYPRDVSLSIDTNPVTFRLLQTGPYMERSMDSKADSRVSFTPDGWQRKVLDELDASQSILVVAPTSSGKTFISFYAMEKALRANDDDVVIYVAPTKALVNQVAAEVQARFTKNYKYPGKSVWAIHTRDYRVNIPTSAQILVTVPHVLQIMLLSPSNKNWVPRVKTIIFDEVHTINQAEDGVVWEQLLLMAPCQVIALSATVGNPESFSAWLSETQSTVGKNLEMIVHEHRFSDLRKYVYDAPRSFVFSGLPEKPHLAPLGLEDVPRFDYLHPVQSMRRGRMPPDLAMEPMDSFLLWQTMKKYQGPENQLPADLEPSIYFPNDSISKARGIAWGESLKKVLAEWMQGSEIAFKQVLQELGKNLKQVESPEETDTSETASTTTHSDSDSDSDSESEEDISLETASRPAATGPLANLLNTTLPLLCDLRSANGLPAILFNYNRSSCEDIVKHVRDELVAAETAFKKTDPRWKARMRAFEVWKTAAELRKLAKDKAKGSKSKPGKDDETDSKADLARESAGLEDHRFDGFDPEAPIDKYSFADPKRCDRQVLDKFIDYFQWRGIPEKLIDAFQRGIGVHHSGMNRKYRQAVEICFRRGYLTVVVATGTLSLGINMPCKTVVFSGDSVFLTALNFRQASGRAGRRGFDLLGNVVFQDISVDKACRLLSSRLPDLSGHFPLTTSFILRLLGLLHGTQNSRYAMQMVDSLLSQPRLYLGGESFKHQVLHHVRFSIEYLRSQGLVGPNGEPLNLSSCVSHLYFVEKGAFAFHALLTDGVFHRLSSEMASNEQETLRALMIIMCNLFGRVPLRAIDKESEKESIKRSASVVYLPKMPDEVAEVLKIHNEQTLSTYELYVKTYIEQHCPEPETTLPFTKVSITTPEGAKSTPLDGQLPPTKLRSPFVALSGHGDRFESITDLCSSIRDGVFLEKAVIPYLDMGDELANPLNAYLYDFYMHGQVKTLESANKIRRGEVWFVLSDFSLVLATLVASLENFFKAGDNLDLDLSSVGTVADDMELEKDESEDSVDEVSSAPELTIGSSAVGSEASGPTGSMPSLGAKPKKKAKVADSWDDDGDSSEDGVDTELSEAQARAAKASEEDMGELAEKRLKRVLFMFKKLKEEFDGKFRKIFA